MLGNWHVVNGTCNVYIPTYFLEIRIVLNLNIILKDQ